MIPRERVPAFERMLWFACRGNVFLRYEEILQPLEDAYTVSDHSDIIINMSLDQYSLFQSKYIFFFYFLTKPFAVCTHQTNVLSIKQNILSILSGPVGKCRGWLTANFGTQSCRLESCWKRNSVQYCTGLHCTEVSLSLFHHLYMNTIYVERAIK